MRINSYCKKSRGLNVLSPGKMIVPDLKKYAELKEQLQKRELKLPPVNAEFYLQLTAVHLYYNELTSARFVWRRMPAEIKAESEPLKQMHYLTSALLSNTPHKFFNYIDWNWPDNIKELMVDLKDKVRYDMLMLVGTAYTSIEEKHLADMTNLSSEQLKEICIELGWGNTKNAMGDVFILPKKPLNVVTEPLCSEAQLFKLTEFVSFLEN